MPGVRNVLGTSPSPAKVKPGNFLYHSPVDRKSTRLNSSHDQISYAVFCLKKKKNNRSSPTESMSREKIHSMKDDYSDTHAFYDLVVDEVARGALASL